MTGGAKVYQKWKHTTALTSQSCRLQVQSVIFNDTTTVVELLSVNSPTNVVFSPVTLLMSNSTTADMKGIKQGKLGQELPVANKTVPITLVFEPLPKQVESFYIIE